MRVRYERRRRLLDVTGVARITPCLIRVTPDDGQLQNFTSLDGDGHVDGHLRVSVPPKVETLDSLPGQPRAAAAHAAHGWPGVAADGWAGRTCH